MPVQIYSDFSKFSKFSPMRFRFEDQNRSIQLVEIKQITSYKTFLVSGNKFIQYLCNAKIKNQETTLELIYNVSGHNWLMFES